MKKQHKIVVTGALGSIAYSLMFRLLSGELLGEEEKFALSLLDLPSTEAQFPGLLMEIEDAGSSVLKSVSHSSDPFEAFRDATIVFMLGAKPRGPGMERKDLLQDNGRIFQTQGRALGEKASRDVKVLVVGNPCHTNCLIAMNNASGLMAENFCAMSALDEFRARALLAERLGCPLYDIGPVPVWGNHSSTLVPDPFETIYLPTGKRVADMIEEEWLVSEYVRKVQQRGAEVIKARGKSSAASASASALATMKAWLGRGVHNMSIGRLSTSNPYGIAPDIVFSFPVRFSHGTYQYAVERWGQICPLLLDKVRLSEKELIEERDAVTSLFPS